MRLIAAALLFAACSAGPNNPSDSPSPTPASLEPRTFVSASVTRDGAPFELAPGSELRITFKNGQLNATAGCNTISGGYAMAGDVLVVDQLGMTEMACQPPALMTQEQWFNGLLGSRPTLALAGDSLTVTAGGTVIQMTDRVVAEPDANLVGPVWTVESIIAGESVASAPQGATATMQFGPTGVVTVNDGCNSGVGRYIADANTITFTNIARTLVGCTGSAGTLAAAVTQVLGGGVHYSIDGQTLTLIVGGSGLQLRSNPR